MKIEYNEGNAVYRIEWSDLVHILESPVVTMKTNKISLEKLVYLIENE